MRVAPSLKLLVVLVLLVGISVGTVALAKGKPKPKCPNWDIFCLDVWDPVICNDGKIYSNQCYADRVCAKGCKPTGGGPVPI